MFKKKKKKKNSLERKITKHFRNNPEKEYNYKQVAAVLEIKDTKTRNEIIKILNKLTSEKTLKSSTKGKYKLEQIGSQYYQGILDVTSTGRGFVICDQLEQDILIPKNNINRAFQGDLVEVYVYKRIIYRFSFLFGKSWEIILRNCPTHNNL